MSKNETRSSATSGSYNTIRRGSAAAALQTLPNINLHPNSTFDGHRSKKSSHHKNPMNHDPPARVISVSLTKDEKEHLTAYERLLYESQYDVRFQAEEKAGQRIGFYRLRGNIGLGNFSRVKLGEHLLAKEKVAVKILDKTKLDVSTQRLLLREISSIERLHHPNIIRLYEVIETPNAYYIITEYASGGDLYTRITNNGKLMENEAKYLFAQLIAAVDHMHSKGIVHRDIKCENVLFVNDRLIKLGDFGFSIYSEKDQLLNTFCGSPPYAAPELYRDDNYIGIYVDLWATGVLVYFLITALMPFRAENLAKLRQSVFHGNYSIPSHVSRECQELIRGLLHQEPTERWSIEQIRSCSWLNKQKFPNELEPLPLNLTNFWTSVSKDLTATETARQIPSSLPPRSSFEYEAHVKLEELGLTSELLQKANKYSHDQLLCNRDSINGTYRVLLHRLQKQSDPLERDDQYDRTMNDETSPSFERSRSINGPVNERKKFDVKRRRASHDFTGRKSNRDLNESSTHRTQLCTIL